MRCAALRRAPNQKRLQLPLIRETLVLAARRANSHSWCAAEFATAPWRPVSKTSGALARRLRTSL